MESLAGDGIEKIIEMKEDIAAIKSILSTMANTNTMAIEALQSSRSAHERINRIDKIIFWAGTTIIGGLMLGVIAYIIQGGIAPGK